MVVIRYFSVVLFLSIYCLQVGFNQTLTGVSTIWDDDYREWSLFTAEDTLNLGTLELTGLINSPRMDWSYRVLESFGRIRNIQRNNYTTWEVQGPYNLVNVRQQWPDDLREWRVTDNRLTVNWRSRYQHHYEEWVLSHGDYGHFSMYTLNPGDPRDWVIVDKMRDDFPFEMKMAFVFVTIFFTSPF